MYSTKKYFALGSVPIGIGAVLKGWDFTKEELQSEKLSVVAMRIMTNACPLDCAYCFTDKRPRLLTLSQIKRIIDQFADCGVRGVNFDGEGEPTIDPWFFEIINYAVSKNIQPIVFSEASTRLRDVEFVKQLYATGATVVPKIDSLLNPNYQNSVVGDKTGKFFELRGKALELLMKEGFNNIAADGTTRLGFDMVVTSKNFHEAAETLRFCRQNNLWIVFSFPVSAGRVVQNGFDTNLLLNKDEKNWLRRTVAQTDEIFGFKHQIFPQYITHPCVEYMQVWGDGSITVCPGNEEKVGNILRDSIPEIVNRLSIKFPNRDPRLPNYNGHCPFSFRERS